MTLVFFFSLVFVLVLVILVEVSCDAVESPGRRSGPAAASGKYWRGKFGFAEDFPPWQILKELVHWREIIVLRTCPELVLCLLLSVSPACVWENCNIGQCLYLCWPSLHWHTFSCHHKRNMCRMCPRLVLCVCLSLYLFSVFTNCEPYVIVGVFLDPPCPDIVFLPSQKKHVYWTCPLCLLVCILLLCVQ